MSLCPNLIEDCISDVELLRRIGAGDRASLQELYRRYSGVLFNAAYRVLHNTADAEDVLQEAFVQLWQKAAVYDSRRGKPLTWAMTLTRNKAIDRLRRVQRRSRLQDEIEQESLTRNRIVDRDSSDHALERERQNIVRSAVIQLSPEQRDAIELAFMGGLTQNEVARRLRQPLGTVKARIRRGIMKLRQLLEPGL